MDASPSERADRITDGVIAATRIRFGAVAIAELLEVDGLLLAISNLPTPELNSAHVIRELRIQRRRSRRPRPRPRAAA